jgi:hypothetical protein
MPTSTFELVKQAIQKKQQVIALYKGLRREMCPHVVGWKGGREQALFYQFGGESSSGLDPDGSGNNWRCLFLDDLQIIEARDGAWHTAPNHSRRQPCVDEIAAEVVYEQSRPARA